MATLSLDLRTRILAAYDKCEATRQQVAKRFGVSEGMVKKLLQQRRRTGDIGHRHRFSGNKPRLLQEHGGALRAAVAAHPDLTLGELKARLKLACTPQAIHHVLAAMKLTYKKRLSMRPSRTEPTSRRRAPSGGSAKAH
jgi:transposase